MTCGQCGQLFDEKPSTPDERDIAPEEGLIAGVGTLFCSAPCGATYSTPIIVRQIEAEGESGAARMMANARWN